MSSNLRRELRRRRRALSDSERRAAAEAVAARVCLLTDFAGAKSVGAYAATDGELDPAPLVERCWQQGCRVLLPVVVGPDLCFAAYERDTELVEQRWGIPEPRSADLVEPAELGVVLVPLVAFDRHRNRLGRGRGYYDRAFSFTPRPPLVGLAYELQRVDAVERAPHDVRLDVVATETTIYR